MDGPHSDLNQYQTELSDSVDDGGGCAETWERLSAIREGTNVSRRSVLHAVAGAGVGLTALSSPVSGDSKEDQPVEVTELDDWSRGKILRKALSNREVRRLKFTFVRNRWTPRIADATVVRTEDHEADIVYHTVQIPFDTASEDEQAHILWGDSDEITVQGRHFVHVEENTWQETSFWVENGSVRSKSMERSVDLPAPEGMSTQALCLPWDIHWGCVLVIAGAFATTYGSCAICAGDPTRYTCLVCIGAVLGGGGGIAMCTWCG